jgi:hypothetical protein
MTAGEIAARLHAKPAGIGKWMAHCPAHKDHHASLSIGEGREGRTLLQCFAGCSTDRITAALSLELRDLFGSRDGLPKNRCNRRRPMRGAIIAVLDAQAAHITSELRERGIDGELLTPEINTIRERVARMLRVQLAPLPTPFYEGGYGGRERDILWPEILERAWHETCIESLGFPLLTLDDHVEINERPMLSLFIDAEERAARLMHEIEREAQNV